MMTGHLRDTRAQRLMAGLEETDTDLRWAAAFALIKADFRRRLELEGRSVTLVNALHLLSTRGGLCVAVYRASTWLDLNHHPILSRILDFLAYNYTGIELHVGSTIGPGLVLRDQRGIGIQKSVTIGKNCTILGASTITLGGVENIDLSRDRIVLGNHCIIGVGTRILGAVNLADSTQIKPNSVVLASSALPGGVLSGVAALRRSTVPPDLVAEWNPLQSQPLRCRLSPGPGDHRRNPGADKEGTRLEGPVALDTPARDDRPSGREASMRATPHRQSWSQTLKLISSDIKFRCDYENKRMTRMTAFRMLLNPGVSATASYRFQCFLMTNGLNWPGRLIKAMNRIFYTVDIGNQVRIGGGLCISHPVSILITGNVTIGERCVLFHQNTIGPSSFCEPGLESGPVVVGNDVRFGGGSGAYGNITIGDGCRIGANTVVDRSFQAGSVLFGVPARVIAKTDAVKAAG